MNRGGSRILLAVGFVAAACFLASCGGGQSSVQNVAPKKVTLGEIPSQAGELVFLTQNLQPSPVVLNRGGGAFQVEVPPKFELRANDRIQNLHSEDLPLADADNSQMLQLKPNARLIAGIRSVTIEQGLVRLQFRKLNGEYRVIIPGATLGVRGTTFDVLVRPDLSSAVTLHEGCISITCKGTSTDLQAGCVAEFGPGGSTFKVRIPPSVPGKTFHPESKN